jgi:hypothetical protein
LEHFSLTAFRQTGQANSTFSALALAGFQVATFPTHSRIVQTILQMPTNSELERPAYYGRRIRGLYVSVQHLDFLGKELVGRLVLSNKEDALLPDLRRIDWSADAGSFSHLHTFIQPRLTHISVVVSKGIHTHTLMDLLDSLRARCPDMQQLELKLMEARMYGLTTDDKNSDTPSFALFMELWCTHAFSLRQLTALSFRGFSVSLAVLEHLAVLPRLDRIEVDNCLDSLADLASSRKSLFPVIRSIIASCGDSEGLAFVLANVESTSISSIFIYAMDCAPCRESTLHRILQTIAASRETLSCVDLAFYRRLERPLVGNTEDEYIVTLNTLRPLL